MQDQSFPHRWRGCVVEYKVPIESRQAYKEGKGGATCTPLDKKVPSYCRPWGLQPGCTDDRYKCSHQCN